MACSATAAASLLRRWERLLTRDPPPTWHVRDHSCVFLLSLGLLRAGQPHGVWGQSRRLHNARQWHRNRGMATFPSWHLQMDSSELFGESQKIKKRGPSILPKTD